MKIGDFSFNDSTVIGFKRRENELRILVEHVRDEGSGELRHVEVKIRGVSSIVVDDVVCIDVLMSEEDGEILELKFENGVVELLIQWNTFSKLGSYIRFYEIHAESVGVEDAG